MDITLTLSPITPLDFAFNTPSPPPLPSSTIVPHPILFNLLDAYRATCLCLIIEQRVKVNQKARILELKRRNHEEHCSDNIYAVSIKDDTTYPCPKLTQHPRREDLYAASR
ncbi:hypothetical protein Tco_0411895 [Tanacetum coccineum]